MEKEFNIDDPRWQTLREALEQDSGRCIEDYEGTLAALDSLEAERSAGLAFERYRAEKAEAEVERLREALRTFLDSMGVEFDDPRMKYVVMQVGRRDLEAARAALGGEE